MIITNIFQLNNPSHSFCFSQCDQSLPSQSHDVLLCSRQQWGHELVSPLISHSDQTKLNKTKTYILCLVTFKIVFIVKVVVCINCWNRLTHSVPFLRKTKQHRTKQGNQMCNFWIWPFVWISHNYVSVSSASLFWCHSFSLYQG